MCPGPVHIVIIIRRGGIKLKPQGSSDQCFTSVKNGLSINIISIQAYFLRVEFDEERNNRTNEIMSILCT